MKSIFSLRAFVAAAAVAAISLAATSANAQEAAPVLSKAEPVARAVASAPKVEPVARAVASAPKVRPLSVAIDLISTTKISGTLTDLTSLEMRTSFGAANIPLSEIAGIRFASADDASTTVVMLNGDSITGATDVKLVTVETEWGIATINGPNIASVMFVPGLAWNPTNGLNGKRWNLANTKSPAKPSAAKPATSNPSASSSTTSRAPATSSRSTSRSAYPSRTPQPAYRGR